MTLTNSGTVYRSMSLLTTLDHSRVTSRQLLSLCKINIELSHITKYNLYWYLGLENYILIILSFLEILGSRLPVYSITMAGTLMVSLDEIQMMELNPVACDSLDNPLQAPVKPEDVQKQAATHSDMRQTALPRQTTGVNPPQSTQDDLDVYFPPSLRMVPPKRKPPWQQNPQEPVAVNDEDEEDYEEPVQSHPVSNRYSRTQ